MYGTGDGFFAYLSCDVGPYSWRTTAWTGWSSTCSGSARRERSVACINGKGDAVVDAVCNAGLGETGAKPASSETAAVYSGC